MTKSKLLLTMILTLAFLTASGSIGSVAQAQDVKTSASQAKALTGDEPAPYTVPAPSPPGLITDSPGTAIGTTQYDYQQNGSTGNRLIIDVVGGKHFSWMNAPTFPSPRHIYYNYVDVNNNWLAPGVGVQVNDGSGAGYTTISAFSDDRALVAYHQATMRQLTGAIESAPGSGVFSYSDPPDMLTSAIYWPYITIDRHDRIHMIGTEQPLPEAVGYTRSSDGGVTWTTLQRVDTIMALSTIMISSLVSDKVAIVYSHPINLSYSTDNDIYYVMSQDGVNWDFDNGKVNVTDYENAGTDLRAWDDLDAIFDYNDNLHILWNTGHFISGGYSLRCWLWHYNGGTDQINYVSEHPDSIWSHSVGVFNEPIAKMSLGVGPDNDLFATWTRFDTSDASFTGYCNGEIYMSYTTDGTNWAPETDITNTHTPGCHAGACDSDHWSSLAEQVDANLHLVYIDDKDAGGIPQTEGAATTNPVLYLEYPNPVFAGGEPDMVVSPDPVEVTVHSGEIIGLDMQIQDAGGVPLQYAVAESETWLALSHFRGAVKNGSNGIVGLTFDATGLDPGTYNGQIVINSNDPNGLIATIIPVILNVIGGGCSYLPGDANGNGTTNGVDVGYMVNYLKGFGPPPPDSCDCPPHGWIYAAADVNGNCVFNGVDVTYLVNFLKGLGPAPTSCPDCPPIRQASSDSGSSR